MGMDEIDGNMDENMWMINLMDDKTCSKNLSRWIIQNFELHYH
jgi:hypothetical protein